MSEQVIEKKLRDEEDEVIIEALVETVEDFVKEAGITVEVLPIHENPYRHANDQQSAYHYSCRLINAENKWFVVYFSKGPGLRVWVSPPDEFEASGKPLHVAKTQIGTHYDGPLPPFEGNDAEDDKNVYEKCSIPAMPNIVEILDCLANDSYTIERTGLFESWCVIMKSSPDSMHTRKIFDVCCEHRLKLLALLGHEQYHRLVHEMGREVQVTESESESEEQDG